MGAKKELIARVIDDEGPIGINTVADKTGLSKLTIYPVVSMLIDEGRVTRDGDELHPQ